MIYNNRHFLFFLGHTNHSSLHENLQLVVRQHVLPYDDREPRTRLEASLRDLARIQNGRPPDLLHIADAHEYEQATHDTNQMNDGSRLPVIERPSKHSANVKR